MSTSATLISIPDPTAEARLWQAVIANAVQEWLCGPLRRKRAAERYLFEDQEDLRRVCESAGMNMEWLRSRLWKLRNRSAQSSCAVAA
jgi:hypothetical protein